MAKVRLTPDEWGDFVAIFLLDAMLHTDLLEDNEEFRELIDNLKGKGAKPVLLRYYLNLPSQLRTSYKRMKPVMFRDSGEDQSDIAIRRIREKAKEKEDKEGLVRKVIKTVTGR